MNQYYELIVNYYLARNEVNYVPRKNVYNYNINGKKTTIICSDKYIMEANNQNSIINYFFFNEQSIYHYLVYLKHNHLVIDLGIMDFYDDTIISKYFVYDIVFKSSKTAFREYNYFFPDDDILAKINLWMAKDEVKNCYVYEVDNNEFYDLFTPDEKLMKDIIENTYFDDKKLYKCKLREYKKGND